MYPSTQYGPSQGISFSYPTQPLPRGDVNRQISGALRKVSIFVAGKPRPKARPRIGRYGKFYSPVTEWTNQVYLSALFKKPKPIFDKAVELNLIFYFKSKESSFMSKRPDLDNLIKECMDCLSRASWWKDDSQVAIIHATKFCTPFNEGVNIAVTELDKEKQ